jgi:pimeloyl-ACP methyl ester carboxylesterase
MSASHSEQLVQIQAADGVELAGAVIEPAGRATRPLPIVWIHGYTGRFYEPHALKIGRRLAERGYVFVTGNNRGNNYGTVLRVRATAEERLGGAAWEKLDESPLDVDAWISFAVGRGFDQVVLLGHSLGGMKVTYYLATRDDPRVKGLINASGPVWRFIGPAKEAAERLAEAERLVAAGQGLELLLPFPEPGASTVSAQTVVSGQPFRDVLFGQNGRPPAVALLRCPVFAFLGSEESWLGGPADLAWLKETARAAPRCDTRYFEGADHVYTGHEVEVADAIGDWVDSLD